MRSTRLLVGLGGAAFLLMACVRLVAPVAPEPPPVITGPPALKAPGESCSASADCGSGVCASGVCCERACDAVESCVLPGSRGYCTRRSPGDACDPGQDSQCPSHHCVDGVCCDTGCVGTCFSCINRGQEGTCALASDGSDVRNQCGTGCSACFGGYCLPAQPGTNPHNTCDNGLACGVDGTCAGGPGAACTANNSCASGACLAGTCRSLRDFQLPASLLAPLAKDRFLGAATLDASGRTVVLVRELIETTDAIGDVQMRDLVAREDGQGNWLGLELPTRLICRGHSASFLAQSLVTLGTQILVVSEVDPEQCPMETGRLVAQWIAPNMTPGRRETLDMGPLGGGRGVVSLATRFDGVGVTVAATFYDATTTRSLRLAHNKLAGGDWEYSVPALADAQATVALADINRVTYAVYGGNRTSNETAQDLVVARVDGVTVVEVERAVIPAGCRVASLAAVPVKDTVPWVAIAGESLGGGLYGNAVLWAEFHPEAPQGQRLRAMECVPPPQGGGALSASAAAPVALGDRAGVLFVDGLTSTLYLTWRDAGGMWAQVQVGAIVGVQTLVTNLVTDSVGDRSSFGLQMYDDAASVPLATRVGIIQP